MPHLAAVLRCPFSGLAIDPQTKLPEDAHWDPSPDDLTGTIVEERYLIGQRLGDGAMGTVYRAEHTRLGTIVAVKVLHSRFEAGSQPEERFIREAQAAARIEHPNVIRVFDVGRLPDGAPYLVMEYLQGTELRDELVGGGLPLRTAMNYARQLLEGLACAHAHRIIHRDIKPENLFIIQVEGESLLKILDFSIAKDQNAETMTRDGDVLGTPHYLAPEQALGQPVDARVDLWAAGVVIFELLTGTLPFNGDALPMLVSSILLHDPPPVTSLRKGLSANADAFFERALAKEPAERFSSATAMMAALETLPEDSSDAVDDVVVTTQDVVDLMDTIIDPE